VAIRRHGEALERALLDAAWDELAEGGYAAFTMDAVAVRAGTSRPVLYRRWPDKHDLVRAAVAHALDREVIAVPDTGSLRGDVITLMKSANETRADLVAALLTLELVMTLRPVPASVIEDIVDTIFLPLVTAQ
jgi:AcrR family transcriptional regulator